MDVISQILVASLILLGSGFVTYFFAHNMYNRCPECSTLNAKRRTHCRNCRHFLT